MSDSIIQVRGLGKSYYISHEGGKESYTALRDVVANQAKKIFSFPKKIRPKVNRTMSSTEEFWALNDVSFDIQQGDRVGIIGRNGAGKSTLLKILSRITEPTKGEIRIKGRVASLLEVGTGFHPELTGRENVYLNGAILGMSRSEIKRKFDEIVDFAEVEKFLDTPVKRYSSGMYVRLAFSVAAHLEPDILVLDEVLAVGDSHFQKKCLGKMEDVSKNLGRTVLFVSHNMGIVKQLCQKGLILYQGKIAFFGDTGDAIKHYSNENIIVGRYEINKIPQKEAFFLQISIHNTLGSEQYSFNHDEKIIIKIKNSINKKVDAMCVFIMVLDRNKNPIFPTQSMNIEENMALEIDAEFLTRGFYSIQAFIHIPRLIQFDAVFDICQFSITDNGSSLAIHADYEYGNVFGRCNWK